MKTYLILLIMLLPFVGCGKKAKPLPQTQVVKIEVDTSTLKKSLNKNSLFHKENLTQENRTNKVFKNCFKTGSISLDKRCKKKIDTFLKATSLTNKRNILIEVHTDKGGSVNKNLVLSIKRAKNVAASLYYKEYKNSHVYYQGFGKSKLIYDEQTKKANFENRRVIVKLRPKDFNVSTKEYKLFVKAPKKKYVSKKPKQKKSKKKKTPNISKYTGEADTGWIYFGKASLAKKFKRSCVDDQALKVKHKAISKAQKDEFLSNFYNRKISASFGQNELNIYPIYIYENGKLPISNPMLTLKQKNSKTLRFQTTVNSYRGKKGILYRIFVNGKKSVSCVDFVVSYKNDKVSYGHIYMKNGKDFRLKELK